MVLYMLLVIFIILLINLLFVAGITKQMTKRNVDDSNCGDSRVVKTKVGYVKPSLSRFLLDENKYSCLAGICACGSLC